MDGMRWADGGQEERGVGEEEEAEAEAGLRLQAACRSGGLWGGEQQVDLVSSQPSSPRLSRATIQVHVDGAEGETEDEDEALTPLYIVPILLPVSVLIVPVPVPIPELLVVSVISNSTSPRTPPSFSTSSARTYSSPPSLSNSSNLVCEPERRECEAEMVPRAARALSVVGVELREGEVPDEVSVGRGVKVSTVGRVFLGTRQEGQEEKRKRSEVDTQREVREDHEEYDMMSRTLKIELHFSQSPNTGGTWKTHVTRPLDHRCGVDQYAQYAPRRSRFCGVSACVSKQQVRRDEMRKDEGGEDEAKRTAWSEARRSRFPPRTDTRSSSARPPLVLAPPAPRREVRSPARPPPVTAFRPRSIVTLTPACGAVGMDNLTACPSAPPPPRSLASGLFPLLGIPSSRSLALARFHPLSSSPLHPLPTPHTPNNTRTPTPKCKPLTGVHTSLSVISMSTTNDARNHGSVGACSSGLHELGRGPHQ
ncbi:hypothetical protein K438DRAFT_1782784 [Mycena galopus ATCC 62051]|nr:hypothetical protein K438DRAFT_1782784 [Mycena galopus ATCC 62051]